MLNLLKAEWYKLIHLKSTRVMALIIFIFCIATGYMEKTVMDMTDAMSEEEMMQVQEITETMPQEVRLGVYTSNGSATLKKGEPVDVNMLAESQINGGMFQLFAAIFAVLFVCADWQSGYIKNLAGTGTGRSTLIAAKMIVLAAEVFVMFVFFIMTGLLGSRIFLGDVLYMSEGSALAKMLAVQFLLHLAFAYLVSFLCIAVRNLAFGMTAGVLLASGIVSLFFQLTNIIAVRVFHIADADTSVISLSRAISEVITTADASVFRRGIIVGCAYAAVALILSVVVMERRDVV